MARTLKICPRHKTTFPKGTTCPACRARSTNWKRIAQRIRARDRQCTAVIAGQRCQVMHPLEVHHLTPIAKGGTDADDNLVSLCSEHHALMRSIP